MPPLKYTVAFVERLDRTSGPVDVFGNAIGRQHPIGNLYIGNGRYDLTCECHLDDKADIVRCLRAAADKLESEAYL